MSSPSSELGPHQIQRFVRAGAGAGKTTDLVRRVLDMAAYFWRTEKRHCHLVVTTFTRKATQELRERLMAEALLRNDPALIEFVQRPSHLHISTIHGVLSLFLTRFGSEMGLGPQFQILSSSDLQKFGKRTFRKLIQTNSECAMVATEFLQVLDLKTLLTAFESYYGLWCQGLVRRVSAGDLEILFEAQVKVVLKKIHQLIEWIDREDCPEKWIVYRERLSALAKAVPVGAPSEQRKLFQDFLNAVSVPIRSAKRPSEELGDFKKEVQEELKELTELRWSLDSFQAHEIQSNKFESLAQQFAEVLLQRKIQTGSLSLADLELLSFRLAQNFPETAQLFSQEWDYWMIDEYQDTSPLQVRLIELLMGAKKSFIVGDPQQSIYLFRGAKSEVFSSKEEQVRKLSGAEGEALELMTNYRSRPEVLSFFNSFFHQAASRQFQPMQIGYSKNLTAVEEEAVQYIYCESADKEIESALGRAIELRQKGVPMEQICILSRSNDALAKLARLALKIGLPVQVHSATQFSGRREVQDAVGLLKFLVNPFDNLNFLQLLRSPWLKVPDEVLQDIAGWGEEPYFLKARKWSEAQSVSMDSAWSAVKKLSNYYMQSKDRGVIAAWISALTQLAVLDLSLCLDNSGRREANLWKLVSLVHQAEKEPGFSILQFIDQMTQIQVDSEGDSDATPVIEPQRINLMTVHASKGLQFQYVILLGLGKRYPSARSSFFIADSDSGKWTLSLQDPIEKKWISSPYGQKILTERSAREELEAERVLYVALTRAILGVTLIWSEAPVSSRSKCWAQHISQSIRVAAMAQQESSGQAAPESAQVQSDQTGEEKFQDQSFSWRLRVENGASGDLSQNLLRASEAPLTFLSKAEVRPRWLDPVTGSEKTKSSISVTAILEGENPELQNNIANASERSSGSSVKALEKALRGVEIHRLFEALKYQEIQQNFAELSDPIMQKCLQFVRHWRQGQILDWIQAGQVEWGFAVRHQGLLLQGQIDLWCTTKNEVVVVDYKTGSQAHLEKSVKQLEIYAWALRKMNKVPVGCVVKLVVIYPLDEAVFERSASPDFVPNLA